MKVKTKYKILFALLVVLIVFIYNFYHCIVLKFSGLPGIVLNITDVKNIVFLHGYGVCNQCPGGKFLYSLRGRKDILMIVPKEFSEQDMDNLRGVFMFEGKISRGDGDVETYIRKIAACQKLDSWRTNFYVELSAKRNVKRIQRF